MKWPPRRPSLVSAGTVLYLFAMIARLSALLVKGAYSYLPLGVFHFDRGDAFWPPFPYIMCKFSVFALPEEHPPLIFVFYVLIASAVAPLTYATALTIGLPKRSARIAGVMAAFYPLYVALSPTMPDVSISIVLMGLLCWCGARLAAAPDVQSAVLFSLAALLVMMDRPSTATLIGYLLIVALALARRNRSRHAGLAVALTLAMLLGYSAVRWQAFGNFSPLPGNGGYNLYLGHNKYVAEYLGQNLDLESILRDHSMAEFGMAWGTLGACRYDAEMRARALEYIKDHPRQTVVNTWRKTTHFWGFRLERVYIGAIPQTVKQLSYALPYAICLFGILCAMILSRQRRIHLLALGALMAYALPVLATHPLLRLRLYVEFILFIIAGDGYALLWRSFCNWRGERNSRHAGPT